MAEIEASVEGPVDNIAADATGLGVIVTSMGIAIHFHSGKSASGRVKSIRTPTTTLTPTELRNPAPLPGRTQPGFVGGTIIAEGFYDTDAQLLEADFISVEPAETVILGALTENLPGPPRSLKVNGVALQMLTDARLCSNSDNPATPRFLNQYGFAMNINTATLSPNGPTPTVPPAPTSVEGYFAGGFFHAFLFEFGGTGSLAIDPRVTPQISMERASYRDRGADYEVEARGHVTTSHVPPGSPPQQIEVWRVDVTQTGTEVESLMSRAQVRAVEAGFERWDFRWRSVKPGGLQFGVPLYIRAKNVTGKVPGAPGAPAIPATAEVEPDVREE